MASPPRRDPYLLPREPHATPNPDPRGRRGRRDHYPSSSSSPESDDDDASSSAAVGPSSSAAPYDASSSSFPASSSSFNPSFSFSEDIATKNVAPATLSTHSNGTAHSATHTPHATQSDAMSLPGINKTGPRTNRLTTELAAAVIAPMIVLLALALATWWFCFGKKGRGKGRRSLRKYVSGTRGMGVEVMEKLADERSASAVTADDISDAASQTVSERTLVGADAAAAHQKRASQTSTTTIIHPHTFGLSIPTRTPSDPTPPAAQPTANLPPMARLNPTANTPHANPSYFTGLDTWSSASSSIRGSIVDYNDRRSSSSTTNTITHAHAIDTIGRVRRGVRISVAGTIGAEEPPPPYSLARDTNINPFADPAIPYDRVSLTSSLGDSESGYQSVVDGYGGSGIRRQSGWGGAGFQQQQQQQPRDSLSHRHREEVQRRLLEADPLHRSSSTASGVSSVSGVSELREDERQILRDAGAEGQTWASEREDAGSGVLRESGSTLTRVETPRPFSADTIGSGSTVRAEGSLVRGRGKDGEEGGVEDPFADP